MNSAILQVPTIRAKAVVKILMQYFGNTVTANVNAEKEISVLVIHQLIGVLTASPVEAHGIVH